jgi:ketosteroid isomerase-like protein
VVDESANVQLVRRTYEVIGSIGRTDGFVDPEELAPDLWGRLADDFELWERQDLPDAKVYRGREESKAFWRKTQELFAEVRWEPKGFTEVGDALVVDATVVVRGRESDVALEVGETDVFWFRDGEIVRLRAFADRNEAFEVARTG